MEQQTIVVKQQKSIAPIILGVVGFILNVPGVVCAAACAGAGKGIDRFANSLLEASGEKASQGGGFSFNLLMIVCWLLCFVLLFFGKSKMSKATGVLTIIASVFMVIFAFCSGNWFFGLAAAICYLIGGILSCANASRA